MTLDAYSDTDFAGCLDTRRSTSGGCGLLNGCLVKHWSSTQKVIALSSGEAELMGVVRASSEGLGLQSLCADLGMKIDVRVHTDSSAAVGICRRCGVGKVRHLAVNQLWVQERIRSGDYELLKVLGSCNPGDIFTKHVGRPLIDAHLPRMQVHISEGRAATAPELT